VAVPTLVGTWGTKAAAAGASPGGDITPVIPTHQADDILLLACEAEVGGSIPTPSGGWAHVSGSPQAASGSGLAVFWLRATDGSTTNPTVTSPGDHNIGAVGVIRGCVTSGDPWDVTAGATTGASSSVVTVAGVNTTVADCFVLFCASCSLDNNAARFSLHHGDGLTDFAVQANNHNTNSGNGGGFSIWGGTKASAGATSDGTATLTATSQQGKLLIALKPPVGGGGGAVPNTWHYRATSQGAHFG
jgi:hypothetical protein